MKESKWNSKSGGMGKHRKSGVAHNHAHTIALNREAAREIQRQEELRKKRRGKMYDSVKDVFKDT